MMTSLPYQRLTFTPRFLALIFISLPFTPFTPPRPFFLLLQHQSSSPHRAQPAEATAASSPETRSNMLLGKRPRPPMKRTTSLSEIPLDLNVTPDAPPNDPNHNPNVQPSPDVIHTQPGGSNWSDQSLSTNNHRRHSVDFVETADFLRACFLCKRRLVPGRDIYMYRGDSAFCSLECRQKKMIHDERKEKRCMVSNKQLVAEPSESQVTTKGGSVAAL